MPMINVEDSYILEETGAQVDKVTGLFTKNENATTGEKQMARLNIGAGGSNDNLLDNAYFVGGGSQLGDWVFPINQRGQTSYSAYVNSIDRWYAAAAMTVAADGIVCGAIVQKLPQVAPLDGKTLTFSALLADGTMLSGSAVFNSASDTYFYRDAGASEFLMYNTYFGGFEVVTQRKVAAVKLEYGTVSTLANDAPPDFGEELRKCQRRLFIHDFANGEIIANGFAVSASYSVFSLVLPVSMASDGTLTGTVTANPLIYGGGTGEQVSSFSVSAVKGNYAKIGVATTVMPSNNAVTLYANTNIRLTISKEL